MSSTPESGMIRNTNALKIGEWTIRTEAELKQWGEDWHRTLLSHNIILLRGEMGSGKTTLVRYLIEAAGGNGVSSPTFSLVNEYSTPAGKIYHFDLYRLSEPEELSDIGFEEYLDSGHRCIIEWPDPGIPFYPDDTVTLSITELPGNARQLKLFKGVLI